MKNIIYKTAASLLLVLTLFLSCRKEENDNKIIKEKVTGFVQKGPYINGTRIDISELNDSLSQTGKIFTTTINDNKGSFEISDVELNSKYVEFNALGYYYNEVAGDKSSSQLPLNALSDLTDISSVNVNILTYLEAGRVKYLVDKNMDFAKAKNQAQSEVLSIFGFSFNEMKNSEQLDISLNSENNAILLAISLILQGTRNVADLSEIMANIITDITEDGILNDVLIKSNLYNSAQKLDFETIRQNLEKRYKELGAEIVIPDFESYITSYLQLKIPFSIVAVVTDANCYGDTTGKIDLTISGGTPPYYCRWSFGETTEDINGKEAGVYSVTVTDKNKYTLVKKDIMISHPKLLSVSEKITNADNETATGAIDITVSGGTPPYTFLWSNNAVTEDITNITGGYYTVTITDKNNCSLVNSYSVKKY